MSTAHEMFDREPRFSCSELPGFIVYIAVTEGVVEVLGAVITVVTMFVTMNFVLFSCLTSSGVWS